MNAPRIITASERILTLAKRAIVSDDRDARRDEIMVEFAQMATDLGKMASRIGPTNWGGVVMAAYDLHTAGCNALERQCGTFTHAGSEMALLSQLHAFAAVLGFTLADAATASDEPELDDDAAMAAVEGHDVKVAAE